MPEAYEFRIAGRVSGDLLSTFTPTLSHRNSTETVFVRTVRDDGELVGVIARCETLGLKLLGLRQLTGEASDSASP